MVVAVTQEANERPRRLLELVGMTLIDNFVEFDAPQAMYSIEPHFARNGICSVDQCRVSSKSAGVHSRSSASCERPDRPPGSGADRSVRERAVRDIDLVVACP